MGVTAGHGPLPLTSDCLSWAVVFLCVLASLIFLCSLQAGDKSEDFLDQVR